MRKVIAAALCFAALTVSVGQDAEADSGAPLTQAELRELVSLLRDENADLRRQVDTLRAMSSSCEATLASARSTLEFVSAELSATRHACDATVDATAAACSCPSLWQRRVFNGAMFVTGVLVADTVCDN